MAWQIDPAHSQIQFSGKHMMIATVRGEFKRFTGTVDFNEARPEHSTVDIQIEAASLQTGNDDRDKHLRSGDFLDVENFPTLTFKSKQLEAVRDNSARVIGDLTIRGVTREVQLDVEYVGQSRSPWGTVNAGFTGKAKINRKDWGLVWNVALETGGFLVSDDIKIDIDLELVKQPEVQPETAVEAATA